MKPILLLLFAATAACVGALLPLISRARSKRLLLNAVRRASSDAPDGIGISVLCSGVNRERSGRKTQQRVPSEQPDGEHIADDASGGASQAHGEKFTNHNLNICTVSYTHLTLPTIA